MKICVTTTIYTHTGGLIRLYIVIWSVLSQFKWLLLFLHHAWRGHGARLSIRTKDPNNHSDTETGTLSTHDDIVEMWSVAEKWDLEPQQGGVNRMPPASGVDQVHVRLHISERGFLCGQLRKSYFSLERLSYLGV